VTKQDSLQKVIIGQWGGLDEEQPVWEIDTDSIYYFGEQQSYPCKLLGDSLMVYYKAGPFYLRDISVIEDTLLFYNDLGKVYAYRKKLQ
jgi:hypothetical protein